MYGTSNSSPKEGALLMGEYLKTPCKELIPPVSLIFSAEGMGSFDVTRRFIRSIFSVGGLTVCVVEVTIVTQSGLRRCLPRLFPPKKYCDTAVALMREGGLHVVADVDGKAGLHLLRAMTGGTAYMSGFLLANGVPVEASMFRKVVGVISDVKTPMPNLTVEENINFVVSMRTGVNGGPRGLLVEGACTLTELDRSKVARLLSPSESFRLRLAMEIVRDPPVIIAYYPLDNLCIVDAAECSAVLKKVSTFLGKTVIVCTTTLVTHLFEVADTLLLFGRGGHVLYSGDVAAMPSYFNNLQVSLASCIKDSGNGRGHIEPMHRGSSVPCHVGSFTTLGRDSGARNYGSRGSTYSCMEHEVGTVKEKGLLFSGDEALDLAILWAESEAVTRFYASKFYESRIRRRMLQAMEDYMAPPRDLNDIVPFSSTPAPQCPVFKPFLLWWYDTKQTLRDPEIYVHVTFLSLGLLVISLIIQSQGDGQGGMYNMRGIQFILFFLAMMANIASMGDIDGQLRIFFHQRNSGLYNTGSFLLVLALRTIFLRVAYLLLFVPVVLFVVKVRTEFLLLLGAVSVTHVFFHMTVHAILPQKRLAVSIIRSYLGYCIMFSGFLLNPKSLPSFFGSMSILRWGYGAALAESLRNMPFQCDGAHNTSYCYTGNAYLELEGFQDDSTHFSFAVFSILCGVLIVVMGLALGLRN